MDERSRSSASAMRSISATPVVDSRTVTDTRSCVLTSYSVLSYLHPHMNGGAV